MSRLPNVTTRPNDHGGTDTNMLGGKTVRVALLDGTTWLYVFDDRMVHQYEVSFSSLTPDILVRDTISATLFSTLGVRGAQRDGLMAQINEVRHKSRARWQADNA